MEIAKFNLGFSEAFTKLIIVTVPTPKIWLMHIQNSFHFSTKSMTSLVEHLLFHLFSCILYLDCYNI